MSSASRVRSGVATNRGCLALQPSRPRHCRASKSGRHIWQRHQHPPRLFGSVRSSWVKRVVEPRVAQLGVIEDALLVGGNGLLAPELAEDVAVAGSSSSGRAEQRVWIAEAMSRIRSDATRSAETHLIKLDWPLGSLNGVEIYLKDESVHPTGSLKHRLARSLFIYGLVNNWIGPCTTIVEASSGSTAVSEAYFAKMLGLRFVAVVPRSTSKEKCAAIERQGGVCHFVEDASQMNAEAQRLAEDCRGYYMNQFLNAERATDWRATNNIAESIFQQLKDEQHPTPTWVCVGAGTGGTCATLGRYLRYSGNTTTKLCVADPENSVNYDCWKSGGDRGIISDHGSRIEGIGRPRVEESFLPELVDHMLRVPDSASLASMRFFSEQLGRRVGATTGSNMYAVMQLAKGMVESGHQGSVVTLICDHGKRYARTYWDDDWMREEGIRIKPYQKQLEHFWLTLEWVES